MSIPAVPGGNQPANPGVRCKAKPRDYIDGEEFSPYINHFERVARANGWNDVTKLVQLETVPGVENLVFSLIILGENPIYVGENIVG